MDRVGQSLMPGIQLGKSKIRNYFFPQAIVILLTIYPAVYVFARSPGHQDPPAEARGQDAEKSPTSKAEAEDSKTSLMRFPQNLGNNFVAIFGKDNLKPFIAGAAATGLATTLDDHVHGYFEDRNHSTAFARVGEVMGSGYVMAPAIYGLLLAGNYSRNDRFHSYTYALAQGYTINIGLVSAMKFATHRQRPDGSNHRAFPSAHAASVFMIAGVTERYYGKAAGILGYVIASYVAVSRLAKDVHWTSDVVAGSALGYIVGRSVSRYTGVTQRPRRVIVLPGINPREKSYYLDVLINLPE